MIKKLLKLKKIDTFFEEEDFSPYDYNFLNLDIQGAELLALKGMKNSLEKINYIYTEVNSAEVYKKCAQIEELDEYLSEFGFKRVETKMTPYEWGDAFYIRNND